MSRLAATVAAALALAALAAAPAGAFENPVVPESASGADSPDPWIFRSGGRYWLTYTATGRIEARSSRTLAGLASAHPLQLWPRPGRTEPEQRCCEVWAPEIHRLRGPDGPRWYVYYSAKGSEPGFDHRMYVLESRGDDPAGPYRFRGRLDVPQPFAIDATVATIRGRDYLAYSGGQSFSPTSLYLAPLANPWTVGRQPIRISAPTLPWEAIPVAINEGPEFLPHGDKLHVIYSASHCSTGAYSLGRLTVPRSAALMSPSTWAGAKRPEPVFSSSPAHGVYGPGHGSFFTSPDGRESWMVYHATEDGTGCFTGGLRTTRAQRFRWSRNDIPRFGEPVGLGTDIAAPGGDGTVTAQAEDAAGPVLRARGTVAADRRLVGYAGFRLGADDAGRLRLRVDIPRTGRYSIRLRLLGAPGGGEVTLLRGGAERATRSFARAGERAIEISLGGLRLRRGERAIRLRATSAVTLDQLRLERRPPRR